MPEGDTIWRTANRLRPALVGSEVVRFESARLVGRGPDPGSTVLDVEAREVLARAFLRPHDPATVTRIVQGEQARSTYWCPECQG